MDEVECKELIIASSEVAMMRGGKKKAATEEKVTIDFAFATVCSIEEIKKGETFSEKNIWVKRPGTGEIKAEFFKDVLGKKAKKNIQNDCQISWADIKD